jgi:hypothetical protein
MRSAVEVAGPLGDDHRGDAVADQVGQCTRLRHEAVDPEDQRQARRPARGPTADKRRRQHDEAAAGHAGRALGGEQQHQQQRDLLRQVIGVLVACAMKTAAIVR